MSTSADAAITPPAVPSRIDIDRDPTDPGRVRVRVSDEKTGDQGVRFSLSLASASRLAGYIVNEVANVISGSTGPRQP